MFFQNSTMVAGKESTASGQEAVVGLVAVQSID